MERYYKMALWKNDEELFALARTELSTCPISDVMEQLGFLYPMLPPEIRPLQADMVMIGRAMPVLDDMPLSHNAPKPFGTKPFGLMFESLDTLKPNEVYISTGGPIHAARLGDMLILRATKLGAAGVVVNANIRDANNILKVGLPTFSRGSYAYGLQGRHNVIDFRCAIKIGKTRIKPGDVVFGDGDGVCIVPQEVEEEVFNKALEKVRLEKRVLGEIEAGRSVVETFNSFKIM